MDNYKNILKTLSLIVIFSIKLNSVFAAKVFDSVTFTKVEVIQLKDKHYLQFSLINNSDSEIWICSSNDWKKNNKYNLRIDDSNNQLKIIYAFLSIKHPENKYIEEPYYAKFERLEPLKSKLYKVELTELIPSDEQSISLLNKSRNLERSMNYKFVIEVGYYLINPLLSEGCCLESSNLSTIYLSSFWEMRHPQSKVKYEVENINVR